MTEVQLIKAFDEWWKACPGRLRTKQARDNARLAFLAGCKAASVTKSYRFQAGRWVVTVRATTFAEAKREALRKLDQRADKLGADRPPNGWHLIPIANIK